jgi:hypothetical protein
MLWIAKNRANRPFFDDASGIHHGNSIRRLSNDAKVVGNKEQGKLKRRLHLS